MSNLQNFPSTPTTTTQTTSVKSNARATASLIQTSTTLFNINNLDHNQNHLQQKQEEEEFESLKSSTGHNSNINNNLHHYQYQYKQFSIKKEPLGDYNQQNNNNYCFYQTFQNQLTPIDNNIDSNFMLTSSVTNNNNNNNNNSRASLAREQLIKEGSLGYNIVNNNNNNNNFPTTPSGTSGNSFNNLQENLEKNNQHRNKYQQNCPEENISTVSPIIKYHARKSVKRKFQEDPNCIELKLQPQQQQQQQQQQQDQYHQTGNINLIAAATTTTTIINEQNAISSLNVDMGQEVTYESDGEDDEDDEANFDYEPVLTKILKEKKLALSKSPEVLKLLNSFSKQQQQHDKQKLEEQNKLLLESKDPDNL